MNITALHPKPSSGSAPGSTTLPVCFRKSDANSKCFKWHKSINASKRSESSELELRERPLCCRELSRRPKQASSLIYRQPMLWHGSQYFFNFVIGKKVDTNSYWSAMWAWCTFHVLHFSVQNQEFASLRVLRAAPRSNGRALFARGLELLPARLTRSNTALHGGSYKALQLLSFHFPRFCRALCPVEECRRYLPVNAHIVVHGSGLTDSGLVAC